MNHQDTKITKADPIFWGTRSQPLQPRVPTSNIFTRTAALRVLRSSWLITRRFGASEAATNLLPRPEGVRSVPGTVGDGSPPTPRVEPIDRPVNQLPASLLPPTSSSCSSHRADTSLPSASTRAGRFRPTFPCLLGIVLATNVVASTEAPAPPEASPPEPAIAPVVSTPLRKPGPVAPENLDLWSSILGPESLGWMQRERLRVFGWVNGGYTWSDSGDGMLRIAPRANRFGNEWLLNQAALVVERTLDPHDWSWGARAEFYCGADAALLRPLNGFGPEDNPRFGTDFRQLFAAAHLPVLSDGGVDVKAGRIYVPIGYDSTMSPYRPMYSAPYAWLYSHTGAATGATATWHATPQLDVIAGVTLGYNTFFELRGDGPCYLTRGIYWLTPEKQTRLIGTLYTGPQPIASAKGHVADWQTVVEAQVVHDWNQRWTTALEVNLGWDQDDPKTGGTSEWYGAEGVGIVHLDPRWDLNLRAEVFDDSDGSRTGCAAVYSEFAIGLNFMPRPWLNFRPEVRWDMADHEVYGVTNEIERERDQLSIAFDCLLKF